MSYTINPLQPVLVQDPVTNINAVRKFGVLKGGTEISWKPISSTSFSNSSCSFTAPPPSPLMIVNKKIYLVYSVKFNFTSATNPHAKLIRTGYDAPRFMALSQAMGTIRITINNTSASIQMSDIFEPLMRYNTEYDLFENEMSLTPHYPDQSQKYEDLNGGTRNPLAGYRDGIFGACSQRGAFPVDRLAGAYVNGQNSASFFMTFCETLNLSPLDYGTKSSSAGFIGCQTFDVVINWQNGNLLSRMWSHSSAGGVNDLVCTPDLSAVKPTLLFNYITPSMLMPIPSHREYDYHEINRYITSGNPVIASGNSVIVSSSNIQLQTIPSRIYVFARKQNSALTINDPDAYMSITGVNLLWDNRAGLLSSCTPQDLYNISKRNGCNLSWEQWGPNQTQFISTTSESFFGAVGSVLCLQFGTDIPCSDAQSAGLNGTYQLQMNVTLKNVSSENYAPDLFIVVVSPGSFTIEDNRSISQVGVLSKDDILNVVNKPTLDMDQLDKTAGSGLRLGEMKGNTSGGVRAGARSGGDANVDVLGGKRMSVADLKKRLR